MIRLLFLIVTGFTTLSSWAQFRPTPEGTWIRQSPKEDVWRTTLRENGKPAGDLHVMLAGNGDVVYYIHRACPPTKQIEKIVWSVGDTVAAAIDCNGQVKEAFPEEYERDAPPLPAEVEKVRQDRLYKKGRRFI